MENFGRAGRLAGRQGDAISRAQLLAMGWSDGMIARRRAVGFLHRQLPGVYSVGRPELGPTGWAFAALLWAGERADLSHGWAAWVHRLLPEPEDGPHITTDSRSCHVRPPLILHRVRSLPAGHRITKRGLRVTTIPRTLLDLAESDGPERAATALQAAEFHRFVRREDVEAMLAEASGRRGVMPLRQVLRIPTTRSKLERDFYALLTNAQLPLPATNVKLHGFTVDFVWPGCGLIVETDGWGSHGARTGFESDRRRDAKLLARGYSTMRITAWRLHSEPLAVIADLSGVLATFSARVSG